MSVKFLSNSGNFHQLTSEQKFNNMVSPYTGMYMSSYRESPQSSTGGHITYINSGEVSIVAREQKLFNLKKNL